MGLARTAAVVLALAAGGAGLVACGDDDDDSAQQQTQPSTTTAETTAETTASDAGGFTKPGSELALGETAHVKLKPLDAVDSKTTYPLDVTVHEIEKGSIDDFKGIDLEPNEKASTPYYVKVEVATPDRALPVKDDPDIRFDAIDDRGQEQGSITFLGDFPRCEDKRPPAPFSKGKSYESCLAYLIPGGGSIVAVEWTGSDEYVLKPVTWK